VQLHGGTFELRSELRKGTEAIVTLPKKRVLQSMPPLQPLGRERHRQTPVQAADASRGHARAPIAMAGPRA
jgi:two-component system cell cycle sensor histidine kinase PleC